MLKVALVGVGGISGAHIPAWESMADTELVALCDIRPEQMEKYPEKRRYTDFDEMLEKEEIDILDICLPTYLHADFSVKAMEKTYGNLLSGSMTRLGCRPKWSWDNWMTDKNRSGLVPFDLHIHDLDFMVYAFGKPAKTNAFKSTTETQDYLNTVYQYDGFFITTEASWYASPYPFKAAFRFQFEHAVIAWENGEMKIYEENGKIWSPISGGDGLDTGNIGLPASDAYANEIRYFTDCVENGSFPDKVKPEELECVLDILNTL